MSKRTKRKIVRSSLIFAVEAIKIFLSYLVAWINSLWLIPWAAAERGYEGAYGGEWMLIMLAFIGTYWALSRYINGTEKSRKEV